MVEHIDFTFGGQVDHIKSQPTADKTVHERGVVMSCHQFSMLCFPKYLEQLKLKTSVSSVFQCNSEFEIKTKFDGMYL